MKRTFAIDYLPESAAAYTSGYAIAAIDVIRATTMAATAVSIGHECYAVTSVEEAYCLAAQLDRPILAGEMKGVMPVGFDMNNSPAQLARQVQPERPLVMLSSSGTQLLRNTGACPHVYVACLRNFQAVARLMVARHDRIALIGAGSRGEFREEDQICCAWIAKHLIDSGYVPENKATARTSMLWGNSPAHACATGASAAYLQRTGQLEDLAFILGHVNDLDDVLMMKGGRVVSVPAETRWPAAELAMRSAERAMP